MRKGLLAFCAVVGVLASTAIGGPASAKGSILNLPVPPPSDHIVIEVMTVNGTGCPPNTAAVAVSPDNTAFTVTYSKFLAQFGGGAAPTEGRKNCQLNLKVHVPSGFTYAVSEVDYRGYAQLDKGVSALEKASYYFQGQPQTAYSTHTFTGPYNDDWQATDEVGIASLVWAPCGAQRNLNINAELRFPPTSTPPTAVSFIGMDSTDGSIQTVYHFAWAHC